MLSYYSPRNQSAIGAGKAAALRDAKEKSNFASSRPSTGCAWLRVNPLLRRKRDCARLGVSIPTHCR